MHSDADSKCLKFWNDKGVNQMKTNFYCTSCVTRLIACVKAFKENPRMYFVINCLRSFNLKDADVRCVEETDIMKIVIGRALEKD